MKKAGWRLYRLSSRHAPGKELFHTKHRFGGRFQMGKAILDGLVLHTGDPEPLKRLLTASLMINQAEDQFSFASGVRCVDDALHILTLHELLQNTELLLGRRRYLILPRGGQDGKIGKVPFGIGFVLAFRRRPFHQIADTPADDIAVALQISVEAFICAQHLGQGLGQRGLLGEYKFHSGLLLTKNTPPIREDERSM